MFGENVSPDFVMSFQRSRTLRWLHFCLGVWLVAWSVQADGNPPASFDQIGVTVLRERDASLRGSGVTVAQVEVQQPPDNAYQPSPVYVGLEAEKFLFFDANHPFPTGGGFQEAADHPNYVAGNFYGVMTGVAPDVAGIRVAEANYFFNNFVARVTPVDLGAQVINQSFEIGTSDQNTINAIQQLYDNYVNQFGTVMVSGAGNGGPVGLPSTMYNGLSVGVVGTISTPLTDGRCKPDLMAPGGPPGDFTSFSTPYVSGAAAVLIQSAERLDGGAGTVNSASDRRTVKALLLNGASKPADWTNAPTQPLDRNYGAGMLNVNRSQLQLAAGNYGATATTYVNGNAAHPPPAEMANAIPSYHGWNFTSLSTSGTSDAVDHYFFQLKAGDSASFTFTSTLVWERHQNQTTINNLDLFLYDADSGALITNSISTVDNVEHLYIPQLAPGNYVLQVVKLATGKVSVSENYALAFAFDPMPPNAPASLESTVISDTAIELNWIGDETAKDGYRIERSLNEVMGFSTIATVGSSVYSFQDEGLTPGTTYYYRIIAVNAGVDSPSAVAIVTTLSVRENWRLENFGTADNTGAAADTADPDGDGWPNLVEYALGGNPQIPDSDNARPTVVLYSEGALQYLQIRIPRQGIKPDVVYLVESAGALQEEWTTNVTVITDTADLLEVRDNVPLNGAAARFLRLSISEK